jgi:hypothetical protein
MHHLTDDFVLIIVLGKGINGLMDGRDSFRFLLSCFPYKNFGFSCGSCISW